MFSDRVFQIAFTLSLLAHAVMITQGGGLNIFSPAQKEDRVEVSYVKVPKEPPEDTKSVTAQRDSLLKIPSKVAAERRSPPPFIDTNKIFSKGSAQSMPQSVFNKPAFIKPDVIAVKKKITLPPVDMERINNPTYLSYYQIVREKIRRAAYQNYTRTETGEVYLSFIISNDGYMQDVRIVEEKSAPSPYLRDIALRSIKAASPFPNFSKELDYPQLSFNVIISFEVE